MENILLISLGFIIGVLVYRKFFLFFDEGIDKIKEKLNL